MYSHGMANPVGIRTFAGKEKKGMKYIYYFLLVLWFIPASAQKSETARYLESIGLVNIAEADSSIIIDLMYTRADNFTGKVLYEDLHEAYLHPDAMKGLLLAQQELKKRYPGRRLIVYDAARPMSVQQKMWNVVKGTSKYIYVSNPARGGGLHNYGLAVDISIPNEAALVQSGKMTKQEQANRQLLRSVMRTAGFRALPSEWWHFNWCSRQEAKQKYKVIP